MEEEVVEIDLQWVGRYLGQLVREMLEIKLMKWLWQTGMTLESRDYTWTTEEDPL